MLVNPEGPRGQNPVPMSTSSPAIARPGLPAGGATAITAGAPAEPAERFFPGCFEILVPAVTAIIPQVIQAFRDENQLRDAASRQSPQAIERFLPQLLSIVGPVLTDVIPVLVQGIQNAAQGRSIPRGSGFDDQTLEELLPDLLGGVVPPIIGALPPALQQVAGIFGGLAGGGRNDEALAPRLVDAEVSNRFLGPILQAVLPAIANNLPQLISLINGEPRAGNISWREIQAAQRDTPVSWEDFAQTNRLWDNDVISVQLTPIEDPNAVEIALDLAPHLTWWKGIQVQDDNQAFVNEIWVQDDKKNDSVRVPAGTILDASGYLLFMKAKEFGIHRGMYQLPTGGLSQLRGNRATFFWAAN